MITPSRTLSSRMSPSTSASGLLPPPSNPPTVNVPSPVLPVPSPNNAYTRSEAPHAAYRSWRPSPLMSPATTSFADVPSAYVTAGSNVPLLRPVSTATPALTAIATSMLPSSSKSPVQMPDGPVGTATALRTVKVPLPTPPAPLPFSTEIVL